MVIAKVYILQNYFHGLPKPSDFKLIEEELPPLKDGEFLAEALYVSVDPYMRVRVKDLKLGSTFFGFQVAKIIESKSKEYPIGTKMVGAFGWRSHTIYDGTSKLFAIPPIWKVPDLGDFPLSLALGMVGRVGNTAYFGCLELLRPKNGETLVVSGAGGGVGSHVGQIGKLNGCKVVGITGSDEKGEWLVNELQFDHFINYKKPNFLETLKKYTPDGVDCYFDNTGGEISANVITRMNTYGRITICGLISHYNATEPTAAFPMDTYIQRLQLKVEGFIVRRWVDRWEEGIAQNLQWLKEGKLKYKETVTCGFENFENLIWGLIIVIKSHFAFICKSTMWWLLIC